MLLQQYRITIGALIENPCSSYLQRPSTSHDPTGFLCASPLPLLMWTYEVLPLYSPKESLVTEKISVIVALIDALAASSWAHVRAMHLP